MGLFLNFLHLNTTLKLFSSSEVSNLASKSACLEMNNVYDKESHLSPHVWPILTSWPVPGLLSNKIHTITKDTGRKVLRCPHQTPDKDKPSCTMSFSDNRIRKRSVKVEALQDKPPSWACEGNDGCCSQQLPPFNTPPDKLVGKYSAPTNMKAVFQCDQNN